MTLRSRINLTAQGIRLAGLAIMMGGSIAIEAPALGLVIGGCWMIFSGRLLREWVLPVLFPSTTCPGCRRLVPLVGRWKCGDHYIDHRDRHILAFHCTQGHMLEGFDCPRCRSTILVQRGRKETMRHGSAIRLKTVSNLPQGAGVLIGHDSSKRPVRIPSEIFGCHTAMTGKTGQGKSTSLGNIAKQIIDQGMGLTLLDPGGDLAQAVLHQIPPDREDQTLYIDVGNRQHPVPLNILGARDDMERAMLTEELLGVLEKLYGSAWGPLLAYQLRMAFPSVMEVNGTLKDVYDMFVDSSARLRVLAKLRNPDLKRFWTREFPTIPAVRYTAVTNKLAPIVFHPVLQHIICAKQCLLDADRAIATRQIVLVNLATGSPGGDVTTLLGTFLVQKVVAAAFRQAMLPQEARRRHVLIVDEFQRFMHRAAGFDQILAEARKYKLSLIVANQFVEQLSPSVRAALFGNVGSLIAFRVGHRDAKVLLPEFDSAIAVDLLELERGECLARIGTDWTRLRTPPPLGRPADSPAERICAHTHARITTSTMPGRQQPAHGRRGDPGNEELVQ